MSTVLNWWPLYGTSSKQKNPLYSWYRTQKKIKFLLFLNDPDFKGLTHWGWNQCPLPPFLILQTFWHAFSWTKIFAFWFKSHCNLLSWVHWIISQHWCTYWLATEHASSPSLDQWRPDTPNQICTTQPEWVNNYGIHIKLTSISII